MTEIITEKKQFLTFKLDEIYAFPVVRVMEVLELTRITRVPGAPVFMRGVINSRGSVVPVVDLRKKLSLDDTELTEDSRIVILDVVFNDEQAQLGVLVDEVMEVHSFAENEIEDKPAMGLNLKTDFISGVGMIRDLFIILLNIDKLFSLEELAAVSV